MVLYSNSKTNMGWTEDYNEYDVVKDYTKPLKKIWDNLIPQTYPYVLEFETKKALEVKVKKKMGPYSMTEHFIDYDCKVLIDSKPLIEVGWDGGPVSKEMADKAYGEHYFHDLRSKIVELSKYAGLNFSQFDFGGKITANAKEL